ncbi:unnamed protein product, partial [Polarella glacialis]
MGCLANADHWEQALTLLRDARQQSLEPTASSVVAALRGLDGGLSNRWLLAVELVVKWRAAGGSLDTRACNALLRACGDESEAGHRTNAIAAEMRREAIEPDLSTFGALVSSCARGQFWDLALSRLGALRWAGVEPGSSVFTMALTSCGARWAEALELLAASRRLRLQENLVTSNAVVGACSKAGCVNLAWELMRSMPAAALVPDVVTFNTLLGACATANLAEAGDGRHFWDSALQLVDEMLVSGVEPDGMTLTTSVQAVGRGPGGRWARALGLFAERRSRSLQSYGAAISVCEDVGLWRKALDILAEAGQNGLQLGVVVLGAASSASAKSSRWETALDFLRYMQPRRMEPNLVLYNSILHCAERGGQLQQAEALFH